MKKMITFDPYMGPLQLLQLQDGEDQEVISMKGYSTFPNAPELETQHHMVCCDIQDTSLRWGRTHCRDAVGVLYSPRRLDCGILWINLVDYVYLYIKSSCDDDSIESLDFLSPSIPIVTPSRSSRLYPLSAQS